MEIIFETNKNVDIVVFSTPNGMGEGTTVCDRRLTLEDAEAGFVFSYKAASAGFYTLISTVVIGEKDVAAGSKTVKIKLERRTGKGYEPELMYRWSDEIEDKMFGTEDLCNVDTNALNTPAFCGETQGHRFTTLEEVVAFLQELERQSANAHLYFLDADRSIPVVLFTKTDLSEAKDLDSALTVMRTDGHLTIMYQAQIHGNEPASGEGALAVAEILAKDEVYLEKLDVALAPCVNRYGAEHFSRFGDTHKLNLNRDGLCLRSQIVRKLHWLYGRLMPEVFIDGHELAGRVSFVEKSERGYYLNHLDDIRIICVNNLNQGRGVFADAEKILCKTIVELQRQGFRTFFYKLSCDNTTSCGYARLRNSYTFLIESNGINLGKQHFARRVLSQREAVLSILRQASDKADTICRIVKNAREQMIFMGGRDAGENRFVLKHQASQESGIDVLRPSYDFFGRPVGNPGKMDRAYNIDTCIRSRLRPAAYLLPKGVEGTTEAAEILAANGAAYYELKNGAKVRAIQYSVSEDGILIGDEQTVIFEEGAYVFPMNQEGANVIAASLEPDVDDTVESKGSFVQAGILKKTESGDYPLYRCQDMRMLRLSGKQRDN